MKTLKESDLLTIQDAANQVGITYVKLYYYVRTHQLKTWRLGGKLLIYRESFEKLAEKRGWLCSK